jgi:predicted membrane channel-forming protein YqfA (hemolysin III family)
MATPPEKRRKVGWLEAWRGGYLRYPFVIVLIAANLVPLAGVLFWGWDLFVLMTAYWMETGVIGIWTIVQMAMLARWGALFYVPFFVVHFGMFMIGHLLFLVTMFGPAWAKQIATP